ncbi:hypothetical protein AU074_09250 [Pseudomonas sp. ATCC PTA-122608]|jgi:hypothetical protein|nr:hypothetical protein AU074_09250 [Pseudomonas sp. ATCC PTA-122608]
MSGSSGQQCDAFQNCPFFIQTLKASAAALGGRALQARLAEGNRQAFEQLQVIGLGRLAAAIDVQVGLAKDFFARSRWCSGAEASLMPGVGTRSGRLASPDKSRKA